MFYVSRTGWGLYELFVIFLEEHRLPTAPIYLQDLAILEPKSPELGSRNHKRDTIDRILDDYPDLPFVLIGDSGQDDPELYRDAVRDRPDRTRAVLIRDVTPPERDAEVRRIVQEIVDSGVPAAAAESSVSMARAAADFGLIPHDEIAEVRGGHGPRGGRRLIPRRCPPRELPHRRSPDGSAVAPQTGAPHDSIV